METTAFYVVGIALVIAALVLSAIGLRFQRFPTSRRIAAAAVGVFAVLVAATATGAVINARYEQQERHNEEAAAGLEEVAEEAEEAGQSPQELQQQTQAGASGEQLFVDLGCGGCHTLADAGSDATTGPNLDEALSGQSAAFVRESIVEPNAEIAKGFSPDVMPQDYGERLSEPELDSLVGYISQSGGKQQ